VNDIFDLKTDPEATEFHSEQHESNPTSAPLNVPGRIECQREEALPNQARSFAGEAPNKLDTGTGPLIKNAAQITLVPHLVDKGPRT